MKRNDPTCVAAAKKSLAGLLATFNVPITSTVMQTYAWMTPSPHIMLMFEVQCISVSTTGREIDLVA